MLLIILFRLSI